MLTRQLICYCPATCHLCEVSASSWLYNGVRHRCFALLLPPRRQPRYFGADAALKVAQGVSGTVQEASCPYRSHRSMTTYDRYVCLHHLKRVDQTWLMRIDF